MALRTTPPGEDATKGQRARGVPFFSPGVPSGEDNVTGEGPHRAAYKSVAPASTSNQAMINPNPTATGERGVDFLHIVSEAENQALLYTNQANRRAWSDSLKAIHNEHYSGSKYTRAQSIEDLRSKDALRHAQGPGGGIGLAVWIGGCCKLFGRQ